MVERQAKVVLLHLISELLELARKGKNLDWPAIEEEDRASRTWQLGPLQASH